MCAPELNFLDYGLPHFQTCPLLSRFRGRARVEVLVPLTARQTLHARAFHHLDRRCN